jgi:lipooligosaccharide transport system permease protein
VTALAMVRIVEREAVVFRRLWRAFVFSNVVSPVLFLGAMGLGLGGMIDARSRGVGGLSYVEFIAPGLMAANAMQSGAGMSLWPILGGMKWIRYFHGMVATPVRARDVYWGELVWSGLRTAATSSVFLVIATLFGGIHSPWAVLGVPAAVLCALAFAAPLMAYSATQETDLGFPLVFRLGVMPLFLFSGTFFPVSQLPAAVRPLAAVSPLWHGVELCRAAATGSFRFGPVVAHVAVLSALVALGARWGTRTFERRLSP